MSQFYVHPENSNSIKMYDPTNYELWLTDSVSQEHISVTSPDILWWKLDPEQTNSQNDELGKLYQESEEYVFTNISDPIKVDMFAEVSPIIEELNRMGIAQTREMSFLANKSDIIQKLGRSPISGDVFRISYINIDGKNKVDFYTVVSVTDADLALWRHLHFIINAESTAMDNIPQKIKDYSFLET